MKDIIRRLRSMGSNEWLESGDGIVTVCRDAADEIERLTTLLKASESIKSGYIVEVGRLRAALEKFGSHDANCGFYDHRKLACTCGLDAARGINQQRTVTGPPDNYTDQLKESVGKIFGNE